MNFQKNCFPVFVLIITCVFVLQAPVTYGRSSIDLVNAKINEFPIFELTLDKVTDLFGRPSVVEPPCIIGEKFGAFIHYHDEGLTFIFFHPESDKEQHCTGVSIYLAKKWDKRANRFYGSYAGEILRNVNAKRKAKDVMQTFSDCNPKDLYNEKEVEAKKKLFRDNDDMLKTSISGYTRVQITPPGAKHRVTFEYEETTKFIEKIAVFLLTKNQ